MKKLLLLILSFSSFEVFSQALSENVIEPEINPTLSVRSSGCKYMDQPTYIVNDSYIIYEDCDKRVRLNADTKTFRYPRYSHYGIFALDKNGIYFKGELIETDTTGFAFIGQRESTLWKTRTKVFRNTIEIKGVDAATFTAVNCSNGMYFKDKDFIYYNDQKIEGSDGSSAISESCDNVCYDKNNVYIDGKIAYYEGERLKPVNNVVFKTSKAVVQRNSMPANLKMDAATLRGLSRNYSIDKNHVYYGIDPLPFTVKDLKNVKVWDHVNSRYATDRKTIYTGSDYIITGFDAKTFGVILNSDCFFDKNGIYEWYYDSATETRGHRKFPFNYSEPVSDKNTTRGKRSRYIIYKNHAYDPYDKELFENLSPEQLTLAKEGKLRLSKSGNTKRTDYEYKLYSANNTVYWDGQITGADASSFEMVGGLYKDKNNVYRYSREKGLIKIIGIDAASLKPFNSFIRDKDYIYMGSTRIIKNDNAELLGVFAGYRMGCGLDTTPGSNYYLFRNVEGYWLIESSNTVVIRHLGQSPGTEWHPGLTSFEYY